MSTYQVPYPPCIPPPDVGPDWMVNPFVLLVTLAALWAVLDAEDED